MQSQSLVNLVTLNQGPGKLNGLCACFGHEYRYRLFDPRYVIVNYRTGEVKLMSVWKKSCERFHEIVREM